MKILIWSGSPVYNYATTHRLAKVWVSQEKCVHVEALMPEFDRFAAKVSSMIDDRIAKHDCVFFRMTGETRREQDGTQVSVTRQEIASPGDDIFLDVPRSETTITGWVTGPNIAGYAIDTGASVITEE